MQPTEQIKSKLDIVELISEYLQLKPAGQGSFKACCPFHQERTPSFFVSKSKQIWHCFGCGEGGDQFEFIQKIEGVDFPEALRILAQKTGVELPQYDKREVSQKQKLVEINELAAKFFHRVLLESTVAERAREYIEKRNLTSEVVDDFKLGYAPDEWEMLLNFLIKKGYQENDTSLAGLAVRKERGSGFYDRFRGRLMFPIQNIQGHVVGFTARLLKDDAKEAKYINTPQTQIYNKSDILYGLDKAKRAIAQDDLAIIVEGNMDVISSHRVGVKNVVASSGTALTQSQVNILQRYTNNITFAFDADSAGQVAAKRGIDMALQHGMNVSVILMGDQAKDPDELINRDPAAWKNVIEKKLNVLDYYFTIAKKKYDLSASKDKKEAAKFLLAEIAKLQDKVEQTHWLQELSGLINVGEGILRESLPTNKKADQKDEPIQAPEKKSRHEQAAEKLLAILVNWPYFIEEIKTDFHPEYLPGESYQQIYKNLVLYYNNSRKPNQDNKSALDYREFIGFFKQQGAEPGPENMIEMLAISGEKDWQNIESEIIRKELLMTVQFLHQLFNQAQKEMLAKKMKEYEASGNMEKVKEIMKEFQKYE